MDLGLSALIVVLGTMTFWFWCCFKVKIPPSTPYQFIFFYLVGIALGCISLTSEPAISHASWAIGLGTIFLYLILTGAQKVGDHMLKVGDTIPAFYGFDDQNSEFDSSSLEGKRVLIKFFRGFW